MLGPANGNAVAPFVVSSDLYSKHLLLWIESFLGRKPKGLAAALIENVYSSLLWRVCRYHVPSPPWWVASLGSCGQGLAYCLVDMINGLKL